MNIHNKTFSVIGGDARNVETANSLFLSGFAVKVYAFNDSHTFNNGIICAKSLHEAVSNADCILLPLPYSTNGETIHTPLYDKTLLLSSLVDSLNHSQTVFAGKTDDPFHQALQLKGITHFDYATREEFAILNAIPTAEGAIEIAMHELPFTIHNANCLVLGFGRIAKILQRVLQGLGAQVTIAARKPSDLAFASSFGAEVFSIYEIEKHIHKFQIIFNTVPQLIISKQVLSKAQQKPLIIDLASRPGGVDFTAAKKLDIQAIHALSLPGKVAPTTAGQIICDTVLNILNETEVKQ